MAVEQETKEEWDIEIYPDSEGVLQGQLIVPPNNALGFYCEFSGYVNFSGYLYDARNIVNASAVNVSYSTSYNPVSPIDKGTLFADYNAVGKGAQLGVACKNDGTEKPKADYLKLRWIY